MLQRSKTIARGASCTAVILMLFAAVSFAQIHTPELPRNKWLVLAEEQFEQSHYELAAQSAKNYLREPYVNLYTRRKGDIEKANYYLCLCYLKLNIPGCTDSAIALLHTTADPAYAQRTAYGIAQYYFTHGQLVNAITYYEQAGINNLSNREIVDEKFELAYCYLNTKQFDQAEPLFASIKELRQGKYYVAGNYYYGLLAYNENNYQDALQSFHRIEDEPEYRGIVPYYIAEIYYFTGNKRKALQEAQTMINRPDKLFYDNELHLLAAQCLYEQQQYSDALPYFEYYYDHTDKIKKEELYEMAYCYYSLKKWPNAIEKFKILSNTRDSLAQGAMYLLGDCYIKTDDKQSARNAFGICADMPYSRGQQETAMILYAKLSYEMGYNDEALQQLNTLLTTYPASKYRDEAKTLLSDLLLKTNNYAAAFDQLEDVTERSSNYNAVYQKVAFGYAIQQFEKGNIATADSFMYLSLTHPVDIVYEAASYFWRGELAYRLQHYHNAIVFSKNFIDSKASPSAVAYLSPLATVQHAYLNMGYAAMEENNFSVAQDYFSQAQHGQGEDTSAGMVAVLREADAVFMQKQYPRAIQLYDKIIAGNTEDADYARFQKAILLGLQGKGNEKTEMLQSLINHTPPSPYANPARYELAVSYIEQSKYQAAINMLQPLTESFSGRNYAPKAWIKIGFAYQQLDNETKAIDAYKHVVTEYPASDERIAALDALRNLYIENNQPSAYTRLLKDNNLPSADSTAIDSTYYAAAEVQFASGKWDNARQSMTQYLDQYPNGAFNIKAHYYRAESNYQLKRYKEALTDYDYILQAPWSDFSENSARRAATISYTAKDYNAASGYYSKLRTSAMGKDNLQVAYTGLMQSSYNTAKYNEAALYADTLLTLPGISGSALYEAQLYKAKSLQQFDKADDALLIYKQLITNKDGAIAAESRYHIAEIYLKQGKLRDAEAAANETIRQSAGNDYWIVRSYIILADVLTQEKDYFNARATLQSIVKHTKIAELKQIASKKLDEVNTLEKQKSKLSEE